MRVQLRSQHLQFACQCTLHDQMLVRSHCVGIKVGLGLDETSHKCGVSGSRSPALTNRPLHWRGQSHSRCWPCTGHEGARDAHGEARIFSTTMYRGRCVLSPVSAPCPVFAAARTDRAAAMAWRLPEILPWVHIGRRDGRFAIHRRGRAASNSRNSRWVFSNYPPGYPSRRAASSFTSKKRR